MTRIWEFLRTIGGAVLLLMIGIYLVRSSQAGHLLSHGEYTRALDHYLSGVIRVAGSGGHWLTAKGR